MPKPRVFDCMIFYNEFDLLEIRLNELAPVVDFFVIVEATRTFKGNPKPLYFKENQDRFSDFNDRIRHVIVDDMPTGSTEADHWRREFHQRNEIAQALYDLQPDDMVILSDVDEILRSTAVAEAASIDEDRPAIHFFELAMYRFYLDLRRKKPWLRNGPRSIRYKNLPTLQDLRDSRPPSRNPLKSFSRWIQTSRKFQTPIKRFVHRDAGWHFTSLGGPESLSQKIGAYSHVPKEIRFHGMKPLEVATKWIESGKKSNEFTRTPIDEYYPEYLQQNAERFRHLLSR